MAANRVSVTGITSDLTAIAWPGWVETDGSFDGPDAGPFVGLVNGPVVARVNLLSGAARLGYPPRAENRFPLASIGDFVWEDSDGDGIQDDDEVGVNGVEVTLFADGVEVATTTTATSDGSDGFYLFAGLGVFNDADEAIMYRVAFDVAARYVGFTALLVGDDPPVDSDADLETGLSGVVTLEPGESNRMIDAGVVVEVLEEVEELPETGHESGRLAVLVLLTLGLGTPPARSPRWMMRSGRRGDILQGQNNTHRGRIDTMGRGGRRRLDLNRSPTGSRPSQW